MSKSALASLTAQYTDSENEDGHHAAESPDSQVIIPIQATQTAEIEDKPQPTIKKLKKRSRKSVRRLVSYNDTVISGEEESQESDFSIETESDSELEPDEEKLASLSNNATAHTSTHSPMEVEEDTRESTKEEQTSNTIEKSSKYAHYGINLPPTPRSKPTPELLEKIRGLHEKMKATKMDMNRVIQERKDFRNPSIYEKLIQFCDINEFGTNYPPEIYDPLQWGPESFYEELARVQKNEMLKRQKERKECDKIEQATALARKVEEEAKKRKSKWDQPAVPVALTTTVTGTKGTVISAFGSLPKKPMA